MSFRLIVTEKPSVARDIAQVLGVRGGGDGVLGGDGPVRISWCLGHLTELAEPSHYQPEWASWRMDSLPMLPDTFALTPRKESEKQWRILRDLLRHKECKEVVNACDAGREGELIFANVFRLAGGRAPVQRLWISAMTPAAITEGFRMLRPGKELALLEDAARSRAEADWLVGLNATRAMTLRVRTGTGGTLLSLGRVQTPTLALLCDREQAIEDFVPEDFWQVLVRFGVEAGQYEATWMGPESEAGAPRSPEAAADPDGDEAEERKARGLLRDRIWSEDAVARVLARVDGHDGLVTRVEGKETRERPPLLYDLTALQKEGNIRFKWSAQRVLDLAQSLYERKKVITYPRTDSRHLNTTQEPGLKGLVDSLGFGAYAPAVEAIGGRWPLRLGKRFVDDAEVSDHHAIIPTGVDPRSAGLDADEKRLFDLVARRFLGAFHGDAVFAVQTVDTTIGVDLFRARGKAVLDEGWRAIDPPKTTRKDKGLLPKVRHGEVAKNLETRARHGTTKAPPRHTEASLLGAMERAGEELDDAELKRAMKKRGLGTAATRAAIIETLLSRHYIERKDGDLVPTEQGRALLRLLPVAALRSARLTGEWEARLVAMAEGEDDRDRFMADIRAFTRQMVEELRSAPLAAEVAATLRTVEVADGPVLGTCPRCSGDVREGRRGWSCGGCPLRIPNLVAGREVSARMAKKLLTDGETPPVKGFTSRAGKKFEAALRLDGEGSVGFAFPDPEPLGACPACGKPVRARGKVVTCDTGRECPFVVFAEMSGRTIELDEVRGLLADGRGPVREGFADPAGRPFAGRLVFDGQRVQVVAADPREGALIVGPCPACAGGVAFLGGRWRCGACRFSLPDRVLGRPVLPEDAAALLTTGATPRVYGFRQGPSGPVLKASMRRDGDRIEVDYSSDQPDWDELPLPRGAPKPAFARRLVCPRCLDDADPRPGYVIAGRAAWGCSAWKAGCGFRLPFTVFGKDLTEDEGERLLGKHRATVYARRPVDRNGRVEQARVVLRLGDDPPFGIELRGKEA